MSDDPFFKYVSASEGFFKELIDAKCDESFVETLSERAERISRDMCLQTDQHVTDILKGQLSICYELIDGVERAKSVREDEAKSERRELPPGDWVDET